MPKSSKEKIEADEKKIIEELQKNAKNSIDIIAKNCNCSRQKVWRIVKRLEEDKKIWGYSTVTDDKKLELVRYIMLFKSSVPPVGDVVNKIIDLTVQEKSKAIGIDIISGGYLHGRYDWVVIFTAKNIKSVKKFQEIFLTEYKDMISKVEIMEYIFPLKDGRLINPEIDKIQELF